MVICAKQNQKQNGFCFFNDQQRPNQSGMDACNHQTPILSGTGFEVYVVHNHLYLQVIVFVLTGIGVDWPISPGWSGHLLVDEIPS